MKRNHYLSKDLANLMYYDYSNFTFQLIFACLQPAEIGGETAIVHNRDILPLVYNKYVEKLQRKKIRYMRNIHNIETSNYVSWQNVFYTDDKKVPISFLFVRAVQ